MAGFSTSLMQHLERSSATSAIFCLESSEYNTHCLHSPSQISTDSGSTADKWACQHDKQVTANEESHIFQIHKQKAGYLGNDVCCLSSGLIVPPFPYCSSRYANCFLKWSTALSKICVRKKRETYQKLN